MKNIPHKKPGSRHLSRFRAIALTALLPGVAAAAPRSVTLEEALEIASARNPDLVASRAAAAAADSDASAARRSLRPSLRLDAAAFVSNSPANVFGARLASGSVERSDFDPNLLNDPDPLGHGQATLSLSQPIDLSGRIRLQAEATARQAAAEGARADEAALSIRFQVVSAFHRALLAKQAILVRKAALRSARALEGDISSRRGEGLALKADLLRARSLVRQRETDLLETESELDTLLLRFNALLDGQDQYLPADEPPKAMPDLPKLAPLLKALDLQSTDLREVKSLPGLERPKLSAAKGRRHEVQILEKRLPSHPMVVAARRRLEAARLALQLERRTYRPTLALFGRLDEETGPGSDFSGTVGINLGIPVFDPGASRRKQAAERRLAAAEAGLKSARSRVRLAIESALRRARVARSRLQAAKGGAAEAAEALRVVHQRRLAGLATLTDELETESASLAASLRELATGIEVAIQDAALARATGVL